MIGPSAGPLPWFAFRGAALGPRRIVISRASAGCVAMRAAARPDRRLPGVPPPELVRFRLPVPASESGPPPSGLRARRPERARQDRSSAVRAFESSSSIASAVRPCPQRHGTGLRGRPLTAILRPFWTEGMGDGPPRRADGVAPVASTQKEAHGPLVAAPVTSDPDGGSGAVRCAGVTV